ncbi:MAG: hypothetical protein JZD40_04775 [Sulfolobus sp.]|nr:hypothetical protein [Sulfolobus sp.]
MIVDNHNPSSFYIGSSVSLGRRLVEYLSIISGERSPRTPFERALHNTTPDPWTIIVLAYVPAHLVLVEEQLAICTFLPTLNVNFTVRLNYWLSGFNTLEAITLATEYRGSFIIGSINYIRFTHLIDSFNSIASIRKVEGDSVKGTNIGQPVFVYDFLTGSIMSIYSSVNYAISALKVSQDTIYLSAGSQFVHTQPNRLQIIISSPTQL